MTPRRHANTVPSIRPDIRIQVRLQQVLFGLWFPGTEAFVGSQGLFHLLHLAERGNHPLALQNAAFCASLKVLPLMAPRCFMWVRCFLLVPLLEVFIHA